MTTTDLVACGLAVGVVGLMVPVQRRLAARVAHWRREHPGGHPVLGVVILLAGLLAADLIAAVQVVPHGSPLFVLATAAILPIVLLVVAWPVLGLVFLPVVADRAVQAVFTVCEQGTAERRELLARVRALDAASRR